MNIRGEMRDKRTGRIGVVLQRAGSTPLYEDYRFVVLGTAEAAPNITKPGTYNCVAIRLADLEDPSLHPVQSDPSEVEDYTAPV